MKNLLKTSALAAVLALSANSANAAAGFETYDTFQVNMNFVDALEIHMDPSITFENLVAGDSFEVTAEIILDHDAERHTSCQIDTTSASVSVDNTGTPINDANGLIYLLEMSDGSTNTFDVHVELQDKHDCDGVDIHATAAETTNASAGSSYNGSITIEAAYDTITDVDIALATLIDITESTGSSSLTSTQYDDGTDILEFGVTRTLDFSTDSSGHLDSVISYRDPTGNIDGGTAYLKDDNGVQDDDFTTELNGFNLDGLQEDTSTGGAYNSNDVL
jgi:hypothetical protein